MNIYPLPPRSENGALCVAARIELESRTVNVPEILWFQFPEAEAEFISPRADGFAAALVFLALRLHENMKVEGVLSPRLVEGMMEYQRLQCARYPKRYAPIEIHAAEMAATEPSRGKYASALSGGADSTYTLWKHTRRNDAKADKTLDYAMFVHGLDIGLHDKRTYDACASGFRKNYGAWGIRLLTPSTNVRAFSEGHNWPWENQVALAALAHFYGKELGRLYVATSSYYGQGAGGNANHMLDELLSTESVKVVGDGADVTKFQRIEAIATAQETYECLRVCNVKQNGLLNCCECDKCISTMTALELVRALDQYKTFPKPLTGNKIRFRRTSHFLIHNYESFMRAAMERQRYGRAADIGFKLGWNYVRWGGIWAKRRVTGRM